MKRGLLQILNFFDIKGGVILGLFSLEMLAIIPYYAIAGRPLPATIRDVYLGVVAAFAASQTARRIAGVKK